MSTAPDPSPTRNVSLRLLQGGPDAPAPHAPARIPAPQAPVHAGVPREVILAAQDGDLEAFTAIVDEFQQMVYGTVYRLIGGRFREQVEDVTQDILFAIWRKLESFQGVGSLEAWCYRFCVLEVRGRIRARRMGSVRDELLTDLPEPEEDSIDGEELQQAYQELERLGPPASNVIAMKLLEGWTFDRIAEHLAEPPGTVRAWYYRGMRKLRRMMGVVEADGPEAAR